MISLLLGASLTASYSTPVTEQQDTTVTDPEETVWKAVYHTPVSESGDQESTTTMTPVSRIETCTEVNPTGVFLENGEQLNLDGYITVIFRIVPNFFYKDQVAM